ncbi:MAG: hypothetical protein JXR36_00185 [Bacteroidales bacterium]|nr:hypothetical protein [Bacteroidales bacterium]
MKPANLYIVLLLIAMFLSINIGNIGTSPSFFAAYEANIVHLSYNNFID